MRVRIGFLMVVAASLALVGCSSDDKAAGTTTTTEAPSKDAETTTTTEFIVDDEEFGGITEDLNERLAKEGATVCEIVEEMSTPMPTPNSADQVKAAVEVSANLFARLADAAPPEAASSAQVLREVAAALPGEAEAVGWDPAKMASLPSITSAQLQQSITALVIASKCSPAAG